MCQSEPNQTAEWGELTQVQMLLGMRCLTARGSWIKPTPTTPTPPRSRSFSMFVHDLSMSVWVLSGFSWLPTIQNDLRCVWLFVSNDLSPGYTPKNPSKKQHKPLVEKRNNEVSVGAFPSRVCRSQNSLDAKRKRAQITVGGQSRDLLQLFDKWCWAACWDRGFCVKGNLNNH